MTIDDAERPIPVSRGQSRRAAAAAGHPLVDAPYNGEDRKRDGFILQAVLPDGERCWFLRQDQPLQEALREVCAVLDGIGGKVETISSPTTIFRDLRGSRAPANSWQFATPATPEALYLGRIGRLDLLAS